MVKIGPKKPRGKPFAKGEDERRVIPMPTGGRTATFTREMKTFLLTAAENVGNRLVALSNARLDFVAPFEQRRFSLRFLVGGEVSSLSFSTMARQRLSARVQWTSIASASTGSMLRQ
jgi:hypothetical protein